MNTWYPPGHRADEAQGVALLEGSRRRRRSTEVHVLDPGAPHQPGCPAGGAGPQRQVGFLAIGEVDPSNSPISSRHARRSAMSVPVRVVGGPPAGIG